RWGEVGGWGGGGVLGGAGGGGDTAGRRPEAHVTPLHDLKVVPCGDCDCFLLRSSCPCEKRGFSAASATPRCQIRHWHIRFAAGGADRRLAGGFHDSPRRAERRSRGSERP